MSDFYHEAFVGHDDLPVNRSLGHQAGSKARIAEARKVEIGRMEIHCRLVWESGGDVFWWL